jgi:hypothetical protein
MEDNKNPSYDQEDRDYKDAPMTTDFEKSQLNNDPNHAYQENAEQFEEFSKDQPNGGSTNNGTISNSGNIEKEKWKNEGNLDSNMDGNSDTPYPISDPDDDFKEENIGYDGNSKSETDVESDIDDEDLNEESDFDESDFDDADDEDLDDADGMDWENSELRL